MGKPLALAQVAGQVVAEVLDEGREVARRGEEAEVEDGHGGQAFGFAQDLQARGHTRGDEADDGQPGLGRR